MSPCGSTLISCRRMSRIVAFEIRTQFVVHVRNIELSNHANQPPLLMITVIYSVCRFSQLTRYHWMYSLPGSDELCFAIHMVRIGH